MSGFYSSVDEKSFKLPDMGEYYDQELVEEYLESVDPNSTKNAAYYIEEPFSTKLGYHPDYEVFVIKATPVIKATDDGNDDTQGKYEEDMNNIDGDTVGFILDSIEDGGEAFTIKNNKYKNFRDYLYNISNYKNFISNRFNLRTVGVNAPEVTHYSMVPFKNNLELGYAKRKVTIAVARANGYSYDKSKFRDDDEVVTFIDGSYNNEKGTAYELVEVFEYNDYPYNLKNGEVMYNHIVCSSYEDGEEEIYTNSKLNKEMCIAKIVYKDDQDEIINTSNMNYGELAKRIMVDTLGKAQDLRILIDANQLANPSYADGPYTKDQFNVDSIENIAKFLRNSWQRAFGDDVYKYKAFNAFGQDKYKRFLGAIYAKIKVNGTNEYEWINVAKYIKSQLGDKMALMGGLTPADIDRNNYLSSAFKLWTYDDSKMEYVDAFFNSGEKDFDDRMKIQKEITGLDYDVFSKYTVMIGDCLLMIPPTSIRVINQTQSDRVQLLRSKASMTKQKPHNDRMIELKLYFNNEIGVNGFPYKTTTPNGEEVTYYMNGLRSLLAMFKLTPFLPIENEYINKILQIDAVSLFNIQINTVPSYPKCLEVTLVLQQFKYRVYLNDLPTPNPDAGEHFDKNMFSSTINYGVMRYYYQRLIQNGESIKNYNTLSDEYVHRTMGSKTNLIPVDFKDHNIKFYKLDEVWLDTMLTVKEKSARTPINQIAPISDTVRRWADETGIAISNILKLFMGKKKLSFPLDLKSTEASSALKRVGDILIGTPECRNLVSMQFVKILKDGTPINYNSTEDGNHDYGVCFKFSLGSLSTNEFTNLIKAVYKTIDIEWESYKSFSNGLLTIKFEKVSLDETERFILDTSSVGYEVAQFFAFRSGYGNFGEDIEGVPDGGNWNDFGKENFEDLEEIKEDALDDETLLSAKFKEYPLDIITQSVTIGMGNTFANTKLKAYDGYAPQYAGGQDTVIDVVFNTMDESTVTALNSLQEIAAADLMKYRKVINCWPIRIDSEMTRLCGINEVIIESIDISTVPNVPGLYSISCRMISVDRTMRNRESLRRLDAINNAGATNKSGISSLIYKTYFDLNDTLSKVEAYPDLELPTLEELERSGYKYIKYMKNNRHRIYPDPDFYFVYGYAYSSQLLRKSIIDYFKKENLDNAVSEIEKSEYEYVDNLGGQTLNVTANLDNKEEVLNYKPKNIAIDEAYKESVKLSNDAISQGREGTTTEENLLRKTLGDVQDSYKKFELYENEIITNSTKHWSVTPKIKCGLGDISLKHKNDSEVNNEFEKLNKELIEIIDKELYTPIPNITDSNPIKEYSNFLESGKMDIKQFVDVYFNGKEDSVWTKIFDKIGTYQGTVNMNFVLNSTIRKTLVGIYKAAATALSGDTEYSKNLSKDYYMPKSHIKKYGAKGAIGDKEDYVPYSMITDKNTGSSYVASSIEQAIEQGVTFGAYQIRMYDRDYLRDFYGTSDSFAQFDFLDPYYNKTLHKKKFGKELSKEELDKHKEMMLQSAMYSILAFNRVVLVWLKKIISDKVYITYFDLRRDDLIKEYENILKVMNENFGDVSTEKDKIKPTSSNPTNASSNIYSSGSSTPMPTQTNNTVTDNNDLSTIIDDGKDMISSLKTYEDELIIGKVFLPLVCAVTHGDSYIYGDVINRDFGTLEMKTQECQYDFSLEENISDGERNFRKLIRAFKIKEIDIISGYDKLAYSNPTRLESKLRDRAEKLWVKASEDPSLWVMHSFYDMVVNDKRGRMARAFPTYYMLLIDEGREIGYWKLHDNFYDMSAIAEIEITKSRKIAADTARVVMTNMYGTFKENDEDIRTDYEHNLLDVFTSIFNPHEQFTEEERKRTEQLEINRIVLRPGVRIQLRMGYSGDTSSLPILFNGRIAEVGTGELVEIIAQSDAHELVNPYVFSGAAADDLAELKNENVISIARWITNFFNEGATPKELISGMLTTKGNFTQSVLNWVSNGRFYNDNMFGIVNFGEIDYKVIHKNGEIMQNIYEAEGGMPWTKLATAGSTAELHTLPEPPCFTIDLKDKSVWDVLHICASTSLEFITSVIPFGVRSSIFFGRPHYYCAYNYYMNDSGQIMEKRKPFQQYHLIDSFTDIIHNNIKANGADVKTCAVPIYKGPNWHGKTIEKKTPSMLWIDFDIYPEYQKTITVNTGMTYKNSKLGFLLYNKFKDEWSDQGGQKIAWRMGARALKDSVKDMYQGEVSIIGDPSIKPYDRVYLHDIYENMAGSMEVEAVVHRMSVETGFTSSVYADCISNVDNRYEQIGQMWSNQVFAQVIASKAIAHVLSKTFDTTTRPMLQYIAKTANKAAYVSSKGVNFAASMIGQDELIKYTQVENWSNAFYNTIGLDSNQISIWSALDKMDKWQDTMSIVSMSDMSLLNNVDDVLDVFNKTVDTINDIDMKEVSKSLESVKNSGKFNNKDSEVFDDAIKALTKQQQLIETSSTQYVRNVATSVVNHASASANLTEDAAQSIREINKILSGSEITTAQSRILKDNINKLSGNIAGLFDDKTFVTSIVRYSDDVKDVMKSTQTALNVKNVRKTLSKTTAALVGGPIGIIVSFVAETILEYILVKSLYNWIENKMASFNVLTIYPMKKDSLVMTAGIDGHKGLVVGSPTYNQYGAVDKFIVWAFKDRGWFGTLLSSIFYSDNMRAIAETYKRDNEMGDYNSETQKAEMTLNQMLQTITESQVSSYSTFKSIATVKRVEDLQSKRGELAWRRNKIGLDEDINNNPIILNELIPITKENKVISAYFKNGSLRIAHTYDSKDGINNTNIERPRYTFNTKQCGVVDTYTMNIGTSDKPIIDIPFVRYDLFQILFKIITEIAILNNSMNPGEENQKVFYLLSGTTVGSNQWSATGYEMKFKVTNYENLGELLDMIKLQLEDVYLASNNKEHQVFRWKKIDNDVYKILLSPRDVEVEGLI